MLSSRLFRDESSGHISIPVTRPRYARGFLVFVILAALALAAVAVLRLPATTHDPGKALRRLT